MAVYDNLKWFIMNCTILGLLPPVCNGVFTPRRVIFAFHFFLFCVITAAYVLVGTDINVISALYNDAMTKLLQVILMNMIVINFAMSTHIIKIKQLQTMFDRFVKFDKLCGSKSEVVISNVRLVFILTSGVATILLVLSTILYLFQAKFTYILALDITCKYLYNVIVHFIIILLYSIKLRMEKINTNALDIRNNLTPDYVYSVTKMADCIYDAIDLFNSVFGWTLLLMYVHMVFYILRLMHVVIMIMAKTHWKLRFMQIAINCLQPFVSILISNYTTLYKHLI